jgi:signal transduction histidine kinase
MSLQPLPKGTARTLPVRTRLERRDVVLGAAAALTLVVFVLRESISSAAVGITALYVVPVALIALELGAAAGIAAGVGAIGLIGVWLLTTSAHLGAGALVASGIAFVAIGAVCGRFSGRMREAREQQRQLLDSGLALAELTDPRSLTQVIADRALELVPAPGMRVTLASTPPFQVGKLGGETVSLKMRGGDSELGLIEIAVPGSRPFTADERAALELLALQAATAAERQRLLALERGQATLHAELSAAHGQLAEQGDRLESVLAQQERERSDIAHELQEEAAQTLAAVQLGLAAVERDLGSEPSRAQVETLRSSLADTSRTLRELAVGLRPPSLDQLGLGPALRTLAERASARSGHAVEVDLAGIDDRLPTSLESAVYRVVDDMVAWLAPVAGLRVGLDRSSELLRIVATQAGGEPAERAPADLEARIRARLALTAGRLTVEQSGGYTLTALIPVPSNHAGAPRLAQPASPD